MFCTTFLYSVLCPVARCAPTSPLVHMAQASNMTITTREFQLVMEVVRRWALLVNGQHALCDASRCEMIVGFGMGTSYRVCGTLCELSDLLECELCGVRFGAHCCWGPYICIEDSGDLLCELCHHETESMYPEDDPRYVNHRLLAWQNQAELKEQRAVLHGLLTSWKQ